MQQRTQWWISNKSRNRQKRPISVVSLRSDSHLCRLLTTVMTVILFRCGSSVFYMVGCSAIAQNLVLVDVLFREPTLFIAHRLIHETRRPHPQYLWFSVEILMKRSSLSYHSVGLERLEIELRMRSQIDRLIFNLYARTHETICIQPCFDLFILLLLSLASSSGNPLTRDRLKCAD